ncbi:DMT family transporter [Aquimonas voraii]|uniref:EamA-like transporter family protein n=1 Tax=Aquimonas voraii TaxID=265719 RepID=A0A1G6SJJ2_9GAMM|nr:DMT family transporter [Aquimonas voraii]SDD16844.1 EamA-like transporter family protein [Aquimonas voraii]
MRRSSLFGLTGLALLAFAGNSLLCRAALRDTAIDPASFTLLRMVSGALVLALLVGLRSPVQLRSGSWISAAALFAYAIAFSYAYIGLSAGTGALILFGAVQASMLGWALLRGERFGALQSLGFALAIAGLIGLLLPGLSAPPIGAALLMLLAGVAWGVYSLRGRGAGEPTAVTAGNFLRAVPMAAAALAVALLLAPDAMQIDAPGSLYAIASGALTSGLGYAIWYRALPQLRASTAATVQLSVPVITAVAGVLLLSEPLSLRLVLASVAVLGGVALVVLWPKSTR